jgi:hypothetical protein
MNKETRLVRLGWFWWVGHRRHDGRSGHNYTCPLLMTVYGIYLKVVRGQNVGWHVYSHRWLEQGDAYESASIIRDYGTHGAEITCRWPRWMVGAEMKARRMLAR